jgi:hypothetical protein
MAALIPAAIFLSDPSRAASLADGYADPDRVAGDLRSVAGKLSGAKVVEYGRSRSGKPLLALEVHRGEGDPTLRPALLVVGGCEPERLATVEMALAIAARAGAVPDTGSDPLATTVLYVIAEAAPDGRAHVLAGGGGWIGGPIDDDGDGKADEDGPDDLDGDGALRWMRVWRTGGAWRADTADVRASVKADPAGGKPGQFDLVREGKDDDRDERLNEDGAGGVRFDANFPHAWALFGPGAGLYPMSEPESKALAITCWRGRISRRRWCFPVRTISAARAVGRRRRAPVVARGAAGVVEVVEVVVALALAVVAVPVPAGPVVAAAAVVRRARAVPVRVPPKGARPPIAPCPRVALPVRPASTCMAKSP